MIFLIFRLIARHFSSSGYLTSGNITLDNFKHGQTSWSIFHHGQNSEITIPISGGYEVTFSATHWSSTSSDKNSQVDLIVNGEAKRSAYGTVGTIGWSQSFGRKWFIELNKNDTINFQNLKSYSLKAEEEDELFIKLQYMTVIA